ncbi:Fc.00g098090.m01.CDS01 [Cosmosporella sp. VM-42]
MVLGNGDTEEALIRAIRFTPIIDHHAHPLVKLASIKKYPLLSITTEAHGGALEDARNALAHFRAVKQLSGILGCEPTWPAVSAAVEKKQTGDYEAWIKRCVSGIEAVLVDDGLDSQANAEHYKYFDKFTNSPTKRIVRIEQVAEGIIDEACTKYKTANQALGAVIDQFSHAIGKSILDPEVVGFKSVICYRTGLAIPRQVDIGAATRAFQDIFQQKTQSRGKPFARLQHPGLNEYFVHRLASAIRDTTVTFKKPIQFHTGLGDNDITLTTASPAHLQEFIREYPSVPIVLLHAGWPFVRETSFLATTYSNVYADIGEVFPCLSRDGQESVVRTMLEFCPGTKVLWSTDGHWFPETYLLAVEQIRKALLNVLTDYAHKGDITWVQATRLVENILFNNANKLYRLRLQPRPFSPESEPETRASGDFQAMTNFLAGQKEAPKFLRVYWNDYTAMPRMRVIPMQRVWTLLRDDNDFSFGVTKASLGLLQNDVLAPGVSASGEYRLHPDLQTLRLGPRSGHITTMGNFKEKDSVPAQLCPRTLLKRTVEKAARQELSFSLGFEIELLLVRRGNNNKYDALDGDGHAWSIGRAMEHEAAISVIEEAIAQLANAGVYIEMVHPESANGQYEIILPKAPALEAVDTLLYAREVIGNCATAQGFKMTLHPKPFPHSCGTAAHVHMSLATPDGADAESYEPFYAGILKHLRAITAFTYSNPVSYDRVMDGCWAGGTWVTWGTQNRETPLRKIEGSHWELKCMDGLANPYLALSSILLAGLNGIANTESMTWADCVRDPASLTADDREVMAIQKQLPSSLPEALDALKEDKELCELMGQYVIERYLTVKTAEEQAFEAMDKDERWRWIIERY